MLAFLVTIALFAPQAPAKEARAWQTGKIVQAEQPQVVVPGSWNPKVAHRYTIETKSERIKATEMVPAAGKRAGPSIGPQPQPSMSFTVGEELKIAKGEPGSGSNRKPDLYILDSKGKEHVLAIEELTSKDQPNR